MNREGTIWFETSTGYTWKVIGKHELEYLYRDGRDNPKYFTKGHILSHDSNFIEDWIESGNLIPAKEENIKKLLAQIDGL